TLSLLAALAAARALLPACRPRPGEERGGGGERGEGGRGVVSPPGLPGPAERGHWPQGGRGPAGDILAVRCRLSRCGPIRPGDPGCPTTLTGGSVRAPGKTPKGKRKKPISLR